MGKKKPVNFELIPEFDPPKSKQLSEPHAVLNEARQHHDHLVEARIALAWRKALQADKDGLLVLGKCLKISDREKETTPYDFVILLNQEAWENLSDAQRLALVDHELCHAQVARGEDGKPKRDERNRLVFRCRKHDLEEFREIVQRHGCYKGDIEAFVGAILRGKDGGLFDQNVGDDIDSHEIGPREIDPREIGPRLAGGVESVTITSGDRSVTLGPDFQEKLRAVGDNLKAQG